MVDKIIQLKSCGKPIFLRFKDEEFLAQMLESDFIKKYIPSPEISEVDSCGFPAIEIIKSKKFEFRQDYPEFTYKGEDYHDVLFLAEYLLERVRQEARIYSVHSSCSEKNNKAVLLFGWKDSGKSSVAINLAREHGYGFVSEGRTVINYEHNVVGRICHLEEDNDFLKQKYGFKEDCLDITKLCPISSRKEIPLKLLIYPQITSGNTEVRKWDVGKSNFHMYELFTNVIRGVAKNINQYTCPVQSIDTQELSEQRSQFTRELVEKIPIYQIRGKLEGICETINELI